MDKVFHSTFDFFTHAVPGFAIVMSILIFNLDFSNLIDLVTIASGVNVAGGIMLLIVSYITGFAINPIGRYLYKNLGFKFWNKKVSNDLDLNIADKYVMIRELSPANFKYVETWNMFCAMAHNLAVSSIVLCFVCVAKIITENTPLNIFLLLLAAVSWISFFIFLHRAVIFSIWAAADLNYSISRLNLVEKAISYNNNNNIQPDGSRSSSIDSHLNQKMNANDNS